MTFFNVAPTYVFLRAPTQAALADDAVDDFVEQADFDRWEEFQFDKDGDTFGDGWLLRVEDAGTAYQLALDCTAELAKFSAWAIWKPGGDVVESVPLGPLTRFLEKCGDAVPHLLMLKRKAGGAPYDQAVAAIDRTLNDPSRACEARKVFEYRDGAIFAICSREEGARMISQRCISHARALDGIGLVDVEFRGETYGIGGVRTDMWDGTNILAEEWADEDVEA